ncbi:hypothetical protein OHA27_15175 [Streptomyces sp. NBC_01619]|uniref:Uncharacterized protein n=1 Tax=Streptomyces pratisoli TaxID=3139917 RepID=A0ACC6QI76_9ACTN|nr:MULTISPECIES: hypothetical protein [unclassified Streptomyces]MCX4511628.1 hypothetical protein [Streptomyces sp. NBC_01619]
MSTVILNPAAGQGPGRGATATGATAHHTHRFGDVLRAVKVFVTTAFGVAILGEYSEEAGVRRHL